MWKKIGIVFLVMMTVVFAAGCGGGNTKQENPAQETVSSVPAGPGPASTDLKQTADNVLKLTESKDWTTLYDYIYADIQKTISREEFVALRTEEANQKKITYKNYQVGESKNVASWTDKTNGITYANVTEVPYTVDVVTPRGEIKINNIMHMIKSKENNWRYLWLKK